MRYEMLGFRLKVAAEMGLSMEELGILRWLVDFWHTGKMQKHVAPDGKTYAWVDYGYFLEDMPAVQCSKRRLRDKFVKLVDAGVLTHTTLREGGVYAYYGFGDRYEELICGDDTPLDGFKGVSDENVRTLRTKSSEPLGQNRQNKYPSTIDQSTSNQYKEKKLKEKDGEDEPLKVGFGDLENVFLTADEYAKLLVKMGDVGREKYINAVSLYKGKSGREYKSDYAACLTFWQKDGRPVEHSPKIVHIPIEQPDLSTPEKILEAIYR